MSFENIINQPVAVRAIKAIILKDQLRDSYLFSGPDGVGKRTVAIEFAKAVNCENKEERTSLCDCASCRKIDSMNHPDIFIIHPEGKSNSIKIEKIRELIYQASLKPYEARKKVFIINDAECLREEAQNAFLKLLEEPPKNHILILTSGNIAGLLATILSRCKVLKFSCLSQPDIQKFLEEHDVDEKEAVLFSHMSMGSIGKAMEFKENNVIARRDQVVNNFFFRKSVLLRESVLNDQIRDDIGSSLHILLYWYRDLLISKFTREAPMLFNVDRHQEISSYAERFPKEKLQKDLLSIIQTIGYLKNNVNPKTAVFNMALELKG